MHRLENAIRTRAKGDAATAPVGRWGIVTGAKGATVKVMIQPEGVQTDWLPLLSSSVGNGWGLVHVPPNGTQVFLVPDAGDHESYVVAGSTWNVEDAAPSSSQGEQWLVHSSGSFVKLTNDGHIKVQDQSGCSFEFQNDGTATLTGHLRVTGSIIGHYGTGAQVGLETHTHTQGNDSRGDTEAPTNPPTPGT